MSENYQPGSVAGQERWRWDLNPRKDRSFTRFRGVRPRPLGDSTAGEPTRARTCRTTSPDPAGNISRKASQTSGREVARPGQVAARA